MDGDRPILSAATRRDKMGATNKEDNEVGRRKISSLIDL